MASTSIKFDVTRFAADGRPTNVTQFAVMNITPQGEFSFWLGDDDKRKQAVSMTNADAIELARFIFERAGLTQPDA